MGDKNLHAGSVLKVWTAIFAVIASAILAGGYWYYREEAEEIRQEKYQAISAIGRLKSAQIQQWRKERLGDISVAAKNPFLAGAIGKFSIDPATPGLQAELRKFLNVTVMADGYSDARLLDLNGNILVGVKETPDPVDAATRRAIARAIACREAVLSDFFRCPDGFVHIDVAAVVLDSEGQPLAVAVLRSNAEAYLYPLIQSWPTPSSSAETLVVQQEGEDIVFLNELRHKAKTAISLRIPLTRTDLPGVQAVLGKQGKFEGKDYRDVEVVADLLPIPGSSWFMVAKMDAEEIFAEARYRASVIAVVVGSFILLAAAGTAYLYRQRQARHFRDRYEAERQQREIQEAYRIILYSIGDAVITTDTDGRARHLNPVAERLTGWTEAEARDRPLEEIFRIVTEETRAIVEDPVQRVLRDGAVVGLANHTLLIARDGTERPIADSGAPIRDESGAIIGVVLVFHDQTEERAAQRALIESEERLRLALAAASQGLYDLNVQTGECVVSPEYARMLGYDPAEFRETNAAWRERLHPDDREKVYRKYEDYVGGRRNEYRVEYRQRTRSGDWKWVLSLGRLVSRSADGQPLRMLGTHTDITERKQTEEALRENEQRLRIANEAGRIGTYVTNLEADKVYWSPELCAILGVPPGAERTGEDAWKIVHKDDLEPVLAESARGMNPDRDGRFFSEHRIIRPDGQVRWVLWRGRTLFRETASGRIPSKRIGACVDITERKQAEEALRESEERHRQIVESSTDAILVRSGEIVIYANPAALKLFRANQAGELVGKRYLDFIHPDDRPGSAERIRKGVDERWTAPPREHRVLTVDGNVVYVESTGVPIHYQGQAQIFGVFRDITDRKLADQRREQLEVQLGQAQKMEAIGGLAGGIAHDFNNILSAIIGYTELAMLNEGASNSENELNQALIAANRAKDLVKQILAFSRQTDEDRMPVKVGLVVKEAVKFLRATIPATIEIKTRIDEKSWAVLANSVELHQIIMNLCTNAQHAIGGRAGLLEVEVHNTEIDLAQKNDLIDLEIGSYVRISVKDTGYGMAPDVITRIFDPYFTTKEKGVGTGLGLAVVHGIVKKYGGAIKVESELGKGTVFHIYLPKADITAPIKAEHPKSILGGSERILFVDDEKMLVAVGQQVLQHLGYDVVSRTSPMEALELFKAKPDHFDLVITDQTMPGMTGEALARELLRIRPTLPVIICTGYSQTIDQERAMKIGIKELVMKPILINEIAGAVRKALDKE